MQKSTIHVADWYFIYYTITFMTISIKIIIDLIYSNYSIRKLSICLKINTNYRYTMSHGSVMGVGVRNSRARILGQSCRYPPSGGGATGFQSLSGYRMFGMPSDQRRTPRGVIFGGTTTWEGGVGRWEHCLPSRWWGKMKPSQNMHKQHVYAILWWFWRDEDDEDLLVTIFLSCNASFPWFLNPNS